MDIFGNKKREKILVFLEKSESPKNLNEIINETKVEHGYAETILFNFRKRKIIQAIKKEGVLKIDTSNPYLRKTVVWHYYVDKSSVIYMEYYKNLLEMNKNYKMPKTLDGLSVRLRGIFKKIPKTPYGIDGNIARFFNNDGPMPYEASWLKIPGLGRLALYDVKSFIASLNDNELNKFKKDVVESWEK